MQRATLAIYIRSHLKINVTKDMLAKYFSIIHFEVNLLRSYKNINWNILCRIILKHNIIYFAHYSFIHICYIAKLFRLYNLKRRTSLSINATHYWIQIFVLGTTSYYNLAFTSRWQSMDGHNNDMANVNML